MQKNDKSEKLKKKILETEELLKASIRHPNNNYLHQAIKKLGEAKKLIT